MPQKPQTSRELKFYSTQTSNAAEQKNNIKRDKLKLLFSF
jgi:hypothetical protein